MYNSKKASLDPVHILTGYYDTDSKIYKILLEHGRLVAKKALKAAAKVSNLNPDLDFIFEAAMLHDIGIFMTNVPGMDCRGTHPYICHGYLGRVILEKIGLPAHALVCERHVGTGLTVHDIIHQGLPLPKREMIPVSIEEQIICYADKFYSKVENAALQEKSISDILKDLGRYGQDKTEVFKSWAELFL